MTGEKLEQNRLEKNYRISADIFREGFKAYQKKFIYPKSYLFTTVFLVLALNFIYGAVKAPDNYFAYIMIVICLALMVREWFNPRKMRRTFTEAVQEMGGQEYKITVADNWVEFSTIEHGNVENLEEKAGENDDSTELSTIQRGDVENSDDYEPVPPSRIETERLGILEYDRFFLFIDGKVMFYIVPKEDFSESETEIIRNLNKN